MSQMVGIIYRPIEYSEIDTNLFASFVRRQIAEDCWRKVDGQWTIKSDPFIDDWSEGDYIFPVKCLRNTIRMGGGVFGAFSDEKLKGFVSVEGILFGSEKQYADLSSIHVSQDMRGVGIGRKLFMEAEEYAKKCGAKKLYISAHSAVETQAFYKAMGCVEALEYNKQHVEKEPFDCQLEYTLN